MNLVNLVTEMGAMVASGFTGVWKDENPEKFDQMEKVFNNLTEVAIHMLQVSPEFRAQFARVHAEFLKYPECKTVIEAAVRATEEDIPVISRH